MGDPGHIMTVRTFLKNAFPEAEIQDWEDEELQAHSFRLEERGSTYLTAIENSFLNGIESARLASRLADFLLIEHLRDLPDTLVVVTREGLKLQYE